jgi:hypothetical protein
MPARAVADGDELQESLLGESQPSSGPMQPSQHHQQIIRYEAFSVESFIQWILRSWVTFLSESNMLWHLYTPARGAVCRAVLSCMLAASSAGQYQCISC